MTEGEFLDRLDGHERRMDDHMAVANEHMAATREHMAATREHMAATREHMAATREHMSRGNELMARVDEEMRLSRKDREEGRAFLRDLNLRSERITKELVEHIGGQTEILRDLHAETLAQRKSIWRVHDKLDELGGASSS